jgi:uncharacterized membrane protein
MQQFLSNSIEAMLANKMLIIRALLSFAILGLVWYIIRMLFFYKPSPDYKDILNVIFGGVLALLPTVINYWFKKDHDEPKDPKTP